MVYLHMNFFSRKIKASASLHSLFTLSPFFKACIYLPYFSLVEKNVGFSEESGFRESGATPIKLFTREWATNTSKEKGNCSVVINVIPLECLSCPLQCWQRCTCCCCSERGRSGSRVQEEVWGCHWSEQLKESETRVTVKKLRTIATLKKTIKEFKLGYIWATVGLFLSRPEGHLK